HIEIPKEKSLKGETIPSFNQENIKMDFQKNADEILLHEYTPAGVVINEQFDIVHFRGNTGAYLTPSPGKPNYNILKMAREGLGFELRNAIHTAKKKNAPAFKERVLMQANGAQQLVSIKVIPLNKTIEPHYLVLFQDSLPLVSKKKKLVAGKDKEDPKDIKILQLEAELIQAREDMRAVTEEQEAANEELQSANEELLSGSEELQSVNEELETTKEELQSGNEEMIVVNQELSERNEKLNDARKYSDVIIATVFEPLIVLNKDMYIRTANKAFYKTFHVNEKETEGKLLYNLGNKQWDIPALRTLLHNVLPSKKEVTDFEMTHTFPDIGERTMLLNAIEIQLENDQEKLILLAVDDITEKKKIWQQLVENENKFRVMSDSSPQIMWTARPDGYLDYYNQTWYDFTGFKEGYGDQSWIPILHPDDVQRCLETYYQSIKTGEPYQIEYRFKDRKNADSYRWFLGKALPVKDEQGKIIKWVGICTDIHEQKTMAEEKFLLEFAEDFSSYKSDEEFFNSLVSYIVRKTGMDYAFIGELAEKKKDSFTIQTLALAHHGTIVANIEYPLPVGPCEEVLNRTIITYPKECMEAFPNNETGTELKVNGYISQPLFNRKGDAIGLIAVMHKEAVSNPEYVAALLNVIARRSEFEMERAKFNDTLRENNFRLESINQNLAQYAYVASHDLQEPLRKIITFSKLITERSKNVLDESVQTNLSKITSSAMRMKQLIQDLLNYSSIEKPGDSFVKTDLNETLQNVLNDFDLLIEEKEASIQNNGFPTIEAVPMQMNQLLHNLVSNSLKFSRPDVVPVIKISYKLLTPDEVANYSQLAQSLDYCEIIFKDNGMGFSQAYAEKVFVIFQRLNDRNEFPGTGIGLALCKKIVEYHGGHIYAESATDEGAIFHIILPLQQGKRERN
ncbi:MAG: PAS domain-containing protein, partial [Bacteroidota bacterium]|nr:PAS domain-containing protein [Bacteroidota bacterium]